MTTLAFRRGLGMLLLTTALCSGPLLAQEAPGGTPPSGGGSSSSLSEGVQEDTQTLLAGINSLSQSALDANLAVTIEVNNSADEDRVAMAQEDASHSSTRLTYILGETISSLLDVSETFSTAVSEASSLTSADASYGKGYFAESNAYGTAYDSTSSTGNPRPFVVSDEIIQYSSSSGSSYPSGHSTSGYTYSLLYAIAFPEAYQSLVYRGAEYAESRVVLGVHYALDTIAARILALKDIVNLLANDPDYLESISSSDYASELSAGIAELRETIESSTGSTISEILASELDSDYAISDDAAAEYIYLMTYGLTNGESTDDPAVVPENAELLIATRFPYLTSEQLREVLATTELASGGALDDGTGWARLNLYAAAGGYGAFDSDVTVTMNAEDGGFSASDTWSNDISGTGGLIKQGTGTLALTGDNSFSGGLTIEGGTIVASSTSVGTGAIVDNATLAMDQEEDGSFANMLSGTGAFLKYGAGELIYTGDGSGFTGTTSVAEGRLSVNGDLSNSEIGVGEGAELGGTGTVGSIYAFAGATVAPGNSIGTLTVNGDVVLASGSTYEVEADADGNSDQLVVSGSVVIDGADLVIDADSGEYDVKTDYTIMTAEEGITGAFSSVTSNFAFLTGSVSYLSDSLLMTLTRNDVSFAEAADTANGKSVASAVYALGEGNAVYDTILTASDAEVGAAFESLTGDFYPSLDTVAFSAALDFGATLRGHDASHGGTVTAKRGAWAAVIGAHASYDGNAEVADVDADLRGLAVGADLISDGDWRYGLAGSALTGSADGAAGETADIDMYQLGATASHDIGPARLRLGATLSSASFDVTRKVVANSLNEQLSAKYDDRATVLFAELGHEFAAGRGTVAPFAGLSWANLSADGFSETGGDAALTAKSVDEDAVFTEIGLRFRQEIGRETQPVTLFGGLSWRHGFDISDATREMSLAGSGFVVGGQPLAEDSISLDLGGAYKLSETASISAAYTGRFGHEISSSAVKVKVSWTF